jgi:hypothetical protein
VVEIVSSRSAPYTGFKLIDPPRFVLDIRGMPDENLTRTTEVNDGNVKEIRFEKSQTQPMATRMVVDLASRTRLPWNRKGLKKPKGLVLNQGFFSSHAP